MIFRGCGDFNGLGWLKGRMEDRMMMMIHGWFMTFHSYPLIICTVVCTFSARLDLWREVVSVPNVLADAFLNNGFA